jgi:hypothetical protein
MGEVRNHTSFYCASIASIRVSIRSISGAAPFCQQHLPGQHRLPTSASNICLGRQHLPVTSAQASNICQHHLLLTALNLNSQHLNGPASAPASGPSISSISVLAPVSGPASQASQPASGQHLAGSPVCCALWTSIPSIGASVHRPRQHMSNDTCDSCIIMYMS